MTLERRQFCKLLGGFVVSLSAAGRGIVAATTGPRPAADPLIGTNAYYLLVEAYRRVKERPLAGVRRTVERYLKDELRLYELRDTSRLNAVRFWAYNDYPRPFGGVLPGAFDARLWDTVNTPDRLAFDVLEALLEGLGQTDLKLIPVLGDYWVSYGGILQYLVWAGELAPEEYRAALCHRDKKEERLYLDYTYRFFTSRGVEHCFRAHNAEVLKRLAKTPNIVIIDVLNEPRGKTEYSLHRRQLEDGRTMSDVVALWLNRQAAWIRRQWSRYGGTPCRISSGGEGWAEEAAPRATTALTGESQYYEGIDLRKNQMIRTDGLDTGSVHVYLHRAARKQKRDVCGEPYRDQRGWEYLLRPDLAKTRENFRHAVEEWIVSRSQLLGPHAWYIGEMGWCWPDTTRNDEPLPSFRLQSERIELYRHWHRTALRAGALGSCVWMLNGCEHKDDFYGLTRYQLAEILGR